MSQSNEVPYQASLRMDGRHFCGGAIIDERHIITAAHCVVGVIEKPFTNVTVMTGANVYSGGQIHRVKAVFPHKDFIHFKQHDIAIVEVKLDLLRCSGLTRLLVSIICFLCHESSFNSIFHDSSPVE